MKTAAIILSMIIAIFPLVQAEIPAAAGTGDGKKQIALTFDDGPHRKYTAIILDILKGYGVKATFFVIGVNAEEHPELVKREADEGHAIGNHTYSHKCSPNDEKGLCEEIAKTDNIIYEITGKYPVLFRPPGGAVTSCVRRASEDKEKRIVLWTIDTRDWAHESVDSIVKNVLKNAKNGSVILFHDYITPDSPTPQALRIIIPALLKQGFEFVLCDADRQAIAIP